MACRSSKLPNLPTHTNQLLLTESRQICSRWRALVLRHSDFIDFIESETSEESFALNGAFRALRTKTQTCLPCSVLSIAPLQFGRQERWDKSDTNKYISKYIPKCLYFSVYISKGIFVMYLNKCSEHKRHSMHVNSIHYCSHNKYGLCAH